jgi:hypothetical protein
MEIRVKETDLSPSLDDEKKTIRGDSWERSGWCPSTMECGDASSWDETQASTTKMDQMLYAEVSKDERVGTGVTSLQGDETHCEENTES